MTTNRGFWSYAHRDDEAENGRISQLQRDIISQYGLITGESVDLFLDRDNLSWGMEWRQEVDAYLIEGIVFVCVITPRYLQSEECRRELSLFIRKAEQLGIRELILPILYVDFPSFHEEPNQDELVTLVRAYQWVDWTTLRFSSQDSPEYRGAVAKLAVRMSQALQSAETKVLEESVVAEIAGDDDESPGYIEKLAKMETTMPEWQNTVTEIGGNIGQIGTIMQSAADEIASGDRQGKGFAARVVVTQKAASQLEPLVTDMQRLANDFSSQLQHIDPGVRYIIERAPQEILENPESESDVTSFLDSLRTLIDNSEEGLGAVETMVDAIGPIEQSSRSIRPVVRKLKSALTVMMDGRNVIRPWGLQLDRLQLPDPLATNNQNNGENDSKDDA